MFSCGDAFIRRFPACLPARRPISCACGQHWPSLTILASSLDMPRDCVEANGPPCSPRMCDYLAFLIFQGPAFAKVAITFFRRQARLMLRTVTSLPGRGFGRPCRRFVFPVRGDVPCDKSSLPVIRSPHAYHGVGCNSDFSLSFTFPSFA